MVNDKIVDLEQGLRSAFIDNSISSNLAYKPQFISNNFQEGRKVISSIENEFLECEEFYISVAFITMGGITPLLQTLKELEAHNIQGRILTTDYLYFSDPKAIKKLAEFKNIKVRMYITQNSNDGFHTKGYLFKKEEIYRIIVGSSNITLGALTTNKEWNTKIISTNHGDYAFSIVNEFESLWNSKNSYEYKDFIDKYINNYIKNKIIKKQKELAKQENLFFLETFKLEPNSMQVGFINNLKKIYNAGENKALLISATGTGKTYASAFAMRELGFKHVLFLVHRNRIAKQALNSYEKVLSSCIKLGLITGNYKDYNADYIFATIQTFSKDEILQKYTKSAFDAIIIDEAHHSSANSYKKVLDYFNPKLWLGMTATPDKRNDNIEGKNIYEIFNYQIAYEIRLQDAMKENLLCPFHYFGITDLDVISDNKNNNLTQLQDFKYLTSDIRVKYVMQQANFYGYSGDRVKGLIFCSRIEEAKELSKKFNINGWNTAVLSGNDSEEIRNNTIERLISDTLTNKLDYILSVDIFSEGVDLPEINQIIMLRPTQSPIVFIQQLGRGLRKYKGKEYVVILDFIGNYDNNYMIPIALSGDRTYNKDNVRRYTTEGVRIIPGSSTIHFDEISRKKIFQSIDKANFNDIKLIKENYTNLKNKLGHIPALIDFDNYGEMDVLRIFDNNNLGSYYKFLVKYEKEYKIRLSEKETKYIEFICKKFASGKRIHELEILNTLLNLNDTNDNIFSILKQKLNRKYKIQISSNCIDNLFNIMTNKFSSGSSKKTYADCIFLKKVNTKYLIDPNFKNLLKNIEFKKILREIVDFGIHRYTEKYKNTYKDTNFVLYQKYTYEDVCRLLCWDKNEVPLNIGGYKYDSKTNTFPIFINYDKCDDISDTIKYEDHFINSNTLISISKSGRTIDSEDVQKFLHSQELNISVDLFVRKNKDDKISKEFYYLGRISPTGKMLEFTMINTNKTAVEIEWTLDVPVREDIYEYIVKT